MKKIRTSLCLFISVIVILTGCSSGESSVEETERNEGKTLVATFTQVGLYDHDYYSNLEPTTVPKIMIFEDGTFDFLCNYDGETAIYSGNWHYFSKDNPIYYAFRITDCVESKNVDQKCIDNVLTLAENYENTFELAHNTARCDADFHAVDNFYFGLTSDDEILFHVEMEEGFEVESTQGDFYIPEESVVKQGIDIDVGIIGYPIEKLLENYKYNDLSVIDFPTNVFIESDSPVFEKNLTGREKNYYVQETDVAITALDGVIIAWEQNVVDMSDYGINNVYQLLQWLKGNFPALLDYEPEMIPGEHNDVLLRWETKQAYVVISVGWGSGTTNWKEAYPIEYFVFSKN